MHKAAKVARKVELPIYHKAKKLSELGVGPFLLRLDHTFWLISSLWIGRKRWC